MSAEDKLRTELLDTARWLDERCQVLLSLFDNPAGWRAGANLAQRQQTIRDEAARLRGRAGLIRVVVGQVQAGV